RWHSVFGQFPPRPPPHLRLHPQRVPERLLHRAPTALRSRRGKNRGKIGGPARAKGGQNHTSVSEPSSTPRTRGTRGPPRRRPRPILALEVRRAASSGAPNGSIRGA